MQNKIFIAQVVLPQILWTATRIPSDPKILIAYFSYSRNTGSAAQYISETLKAKYFLKAIIRLVEEETLHKALIIRVELP